MTARAHETSEQVEILLARAELSLLAAHVQAAHALVLHLGDRLSTAEALSIYCDRQGLSPEETAYVKLHALARTTLPARTAVANGRDAVEHTRPNGRGVLVRTFHRLQDLVDPLHEPELRQSLELALARATAMVIELHVRHALRLVSALTPEITAAAAIRTYLDRLDVAEPLRLAIYSLALARLGSDERLLISGRARDAATRQRALEPAVAPQCVEEDIEC